MVPIQSGSPQAMLDKPSFESRHTATRATCYECSFLHLFVLLLPKLSNICSLFLQQQYKCADAVAWVNVDAALWLHKIKEEDLLRSILHSKQKVICSCSNNTFVQMHKERSWKETCSYPLRTRHDGLFLQQMQRPMSCGGDRSSTMVTP